MCLVGFGFLDIRYIYKVLIIFFGGRVDFRYVDDRRGFCLIYK